MEPARYTGRIEEASMHTLVVRAEDGSGTALFSTEKADRSEAYGLLLGNRVEVEYIGPLEEGARALRIKADSTYAAAVGDWTLPDPLAPDSTMGIRLQTGGVAGSIRMATLRYTEWSCTGTPGELLLRGRSEGSGTASDFEQRATLGVDPEGRATLTLEGTQIVLTRAEE